MTPELDMYRVRVVVSEDERIHAERSAVVLRSGFNRFMSETFADALASVAQGASILPKHRRLSVSITCDLARVL